MISDYGYVSVTAFFPIKQIVELHPWSDNGYLLIRRCATYDDGRVEYVSGFIPTQDLAPILFPEPTHGG